MPVHCSLSHENPDGSAFCDECGEPLNAATPQPPAAAPVHAPVAAATQGCPSCGTVNPAGEAFCSSCGASLLGAPAAVHQELATAISGSADQHISAAPSNALQARLIVEGDNQEFDLSGKDTIVIGREDAVSNIFPDVDLTPHGGEEGGVSRLHARIFFDNGQYMLEDENSTNFTFLNRQRLAAKTPTPLQDNDEVRFGRVMMRFKTP